VKETVTPSDRGLRSCSRTKLDEEQATDGKKTTESTSYWFSNEVSL